MEDLLMLLDSGRAPASIPEPDPATISKQPVTVIEAAPLNKGADKIAPPITDEKKALSYKPAKMVLENYNPALESVIDVSEDVGKKKTEAESNYQGSRSRMLEALSQSSPDFKKYESPYRDEMMKQIEIMKQMSQKSDAAPGDEKPDYLSQAILAFGPALLGSQLGFGGTAGKLAAGSVTPGLLKDYREEMKARREKKTTEKKGLSDQAQIVKALQEAESLDRKSTTEDQKLKLDSLTQNFNMLKEVYKGDADKTKELNSAYADLVKQYTEGVFKGTDKAVDTQVKKDQMDLTDKISKRNAGIQLKKATTPKPADDSKSRALITPFGEAITPSDAKEIKDGWDEKQIFDSSLNQMIALRRKHKGGNVTNRVDVQRGKQLSKDTLLAYKNMVKLGVLSASDTDIINAIIPPDILEFIDPLSAVRGEDPLLNKLESFKKDSDLNFKNKLKNRLLEPSNIESNSLLRGQELPPPPIEKKIGGKTYIKKEDGKWHLQK